MSVAPIDDWSSTHHADLVRDIECHIKQLGGNLSEDEIYTLRRMLMISIRQHIGDTARSLRDYHKGLPKLSEEDKIQMYCNRDGGSDVGMLK